MKYLILLITFSFLSSCNSPKEEGKDESNNESAEVLLEQIKEKEDLISDLSKDLRPGMKTPTVMSEELVDLLLTFYHTFPDNASAPVCLDKVHMVYSAKRQYQKSADYGDTLLNNYPKYINRPMILESMATTYDIFIEPRDTSKVRYYNELLLKEDKEMSQEKREEILFKLNNLDLTLDEMILKVNQ